MFASLLLSALSVIYKPNASLHSTICALLLPSGSPLSSEPRTASSSRFLLSLQFKGCLISSITFFCVNYKPRTTVSFLSNEHENKQQQTILPTRRFPFRTTRRRERQASNKILFYCIPFSTTPSLFTPSTIASDLIPGFRLQPIALRISFQAPLVRFI